MSAGTQRAVILGTVMNVAMSAMLCAQTRPAQSIQYSEPRSNAGATNGAGVLLNPNRLNQIESKLFQPFQGFTPGNSLDGMITPGQTPVMPPPPANNQRTREYIQRKQDWMFVKPEEMYQVKSLEDEYKAPALTPDGRKQSEIRPMERRFLEAAGQWGPDSATKPPEPGVPGYVNATGGKPGELDGSSPFRGNLNSYETSLRKAFGMDPESSAARARESADRFGIQQNFMPPPKPTAAELQRAEEFKQILDFNNTRPADAGTHAEGVVSTPYIDSTFYDPPKPALPTPAIPSASTLGGTLSGGTLGSGASAAWSQPVTPPPPPPKASPPPSPFNTGPRRGF
jgi:hypothetical protein